MGKIWKKYGIILVIVFFILLLALVSLMGFYVITRYNDQLAEREEHINILESSLASIGDLQKGYVVSGDVRAGEEIKADKIVEVDVPIKLGLNIATSEDELVGKYFKIALKDGTVITKEDVVDEQIINSARYYDLVIDETPIGLSVGDYIDIRISLPLGEDFIAIPYKRVEEINSNIPKVVLTEGDILAYNSMLVDKVLYRGSKIYAVKYKEAGAQIAAEAFYPVNKNIQEMAAIDPGLLNAVKQEMVLRRSAIENKLGGLDEKTDAEYQQLLAEIDQARNRMNSSITQSQRELERRIEEDKREAARQAAAGA